LLVLAVLACASVALAAGGNNAITGTILGNWMTNEMPPQWKGKIPSWLPAVDAVSYWYLKTTNAQDKAALLKFGGTPRAKWFFGRNSVRQDIISYVEQVQRGNKNVVVTAAIFALQPYENAAEREHPTHQMVQYYQWYIGEFIKGLKAAGDPHIIVIMQPDFPFVYFQYTKLHIKTHMESLHNAMKQFHNSGLKHCSVYIEAGAPDWPIPPSAPLHAKNWHASMAWALKESGVQYARGIAIGGTHSTTEESQRSYASSVVNELSKMGIHGLHYVTNAGANGHPFTNQENRGTNYIICRTSTQKWCKCAGMPPGIFTDGGMQDARLWFSIPWQGSVGGARPLEDVVHIVTTSPYFNQLQPYTEKYAPASPAKHLTTAPGLKNPGIRP